MTQRPVIIVARKPLASVPIPTTDCKCNRCGSLCISSFTLKTLALAEVVCRECACKEFGPEDIAAMEAVIATLNTGRNPPSDTRLN